MRLGHTRIQRLDVDVLGVERRTDRIAQHQDVL